ncbi:MAG: D-2-hydroxyacid dehydrogenase [Planctomycetota bacterium]
MRIVILDGHAMNPGDLSWIPLEEFGEVIVHDRTAPEEVVERLEGAAVAITNKVRLDRATLDQLGDLEYIGITATGYEIVDLEAARAHGVIVTNVPGYSTPSVAQMTIALLLELTNHIGLHAAACRDGAWSRNPDFCFWERPLLELQGKILGLIGYGAIARAVAPIAHALGMHVAATSPSRTSGNDGTVRFAQLPVILRECDVISLHCPLTEDTQGLIDSQALGLMKPTALLINTARGALLDENAVAEALRRGRLGGCGVDVLASEPPSPANPLLFAPNCVVSPHVAWATTASRQRLLDCVIANLKAHLAGTPQNVVS